MKNSKTILLLLLLAAALITLFSCCSWIYPLQPHDDANWFMSIGKSMLAGKLLYTDVHDQKGPLLFFLHEGAAALSSRSFFGIYLLEILCCFGFLTFSYKTMRMFAAHGICLIATCLVGILTYTSDFMAYGDTAEELLLPVLLYILYRTLRYAKLGELPRRREALLVGMGLAAVFWIKFTILAMCVGAFVALLVLAWRRRKMLPLLHCLAWVGVGATLLTAAVLLYFVMHGNGSDLYQSYFYFNIFRYTAAGKADASEAWWLLKWAGWLLLVGAVLRMRISRDVKLAVAFCLGAELLTFVLLKVYLYYFLTVFVFAPLLIYFVRSIRPRRAATGTAVIALAAAATNFNFMTLLTGHFPKAVLPLAEVVNADADNWKEVLTVKSYDTGIYTQTDCLPPIKYFVTPNAYTEELVTEQTAYIESCRAKYLIMKTERPIFYDAFQVDVTRHYDLLHETEELRRCEMLVHPLYFLWSLGYLRGVIERFYTPEQPTVSYRLYRRKETVEAALAHPSLIGEWEANHGDGRFTMLGFSQHGLVRCKDFCAGEQTSDRTYSYSLCPNRLVLADMYTGTACETIHITAVSASRLVLHGWPKRGKNTFIKQQVIAPMQLPQTETPE